MVSPPVELLLSCLHPNADSGAVCPGFSSVDGQFSPRLNAQKESKVLKDDASITRTVLPYMAGKRVVAASYRQAREAGISATGAEAAG